MTFRQKLIEKLQQSSETNSMQENIRKVGRQGAEGMITSQLDFDISCDLKTLFTLDLIL